MLAKLISFWTMGYVISVYYIVFVSINNRYEKKVQEKREEDLQFDAMMVVGKDIYFFVMMILLYLFWFIQLPLVLQDDLFYWFKNSASINSYLDEISNVVDEDPNSSDMVKSLKNKVQQLRKGK